MAWDGAIRIRLRCAALIALMGAGALGCLSAAAQQTSLQPAPEQPAHKQTGPGTDTDPFLARLLAPLPPVNRRPIAAHRSLDVAVWNLQHLTVQESEAMQQRRQPSRTVWRNTFGAERRTSAWRLRGSAGINADIIALENVSTLNDIRRMFHARTHHIIVSRGALVDLDARFAAANGSRAGYPAVVMRRRAGLRVTGQRHFLAPRLGVSVPAAPIAPALAVRFLLGAKTSFWMLVLGTKADCAGTDGGQATPECEGALLVLSDVKAWLQMMRSKGQQVLVAGSGLEALTGDATKPGKRVSGQAIKPQGSKPDSNSAGKTGSACAHDPPRIEFSRQRGADDDSVDRLAIIDRSVPKPRPCARQARIARQ